MEQTVLGSDGVTVPGGVQDMCRHGTEGHGFIGVVVMSCQLDFMILVVFFNLNDSVIQKKEEQVLSAISQLFSASSHSAQLISGLYTSEALE